MKQINWCVLNKIKARDAVMDKNFKLTNIHLQGDSEACPATPYIVLPIPKFEELIQSFTNLDNTIFMCDLARDDYIKVISPYCVEIYVGGETHTFSASKEIFQQLLEDYLLNSILE